MRMRARNLWYSVLALGCSASPQVDYDPATLEAYLRALPREARLSAEGPSQGSPGALTYTGNAALARQSALFATAVNAPAASVVRSLRAITDLPPSLFDSSKREFVWGPWDNDQGTGKVLLYIRENEAGADFQYSYALARLPGNDVAEATPVIWGAATPDPSDEDQGIGITLWDLEANLEFDRAHDPAFDAGAPRGRGRFVMLYGHEEQSEREVLFNVAVFRNFVASDAPAEQAAVNVDYFYGRVIEQGATRIDFLDSEISADLCDSAPDSCFENDAVADADEVLDLVAVFVNRGFGRAEATLRQGDLATPVSMTECWDTSFDRTFVRVESGDTLLEDGACESPMDQPMSELGLPTLSSIDAELLTRLDCVAQHGLAGCERN